MCRKGKEGTKPDDFQVTDNKEIRLYRLIRSLQSRLDVYRTESGKTYRKVFLSLRNFIYGRGLYDASFSRGLLAGWYVHLRLKGINPSKAAFYVEKLGNLYSGAVREEERPDRELFRNLRTSIRSLGEESPLPVTLSNVARLGCIISSGQLPVAADPLPFHLLLFSLCNGGMPLRDMVSLRKDSLPLLNGPSRKIASMYVEPRRSYVFPLGQGQVGVAGALKDTAQRLRGLLPLIEIGATGTDIDVLLRSLWICAAYRCGIPAEDICAVGEIPEAYSFLRLVEPSVMTGEQRRKTVDDVAGMLCRDRERWFAMRLRPHVRYEELLGRLADSRREEVGARLFYPCHEIARRTGRQIVWKEQPVIRDVVFLRSRPSEVGPLMRDIWNVAWCYRSEGSYVEIPERSMEEFQKAIGIFTPEFEVSAAGAMELRPGDRVVVIGGEYAERLGVVVREGSETGEGSNVVYRIELTDTLGRWNIGVDARLLRQA